MQQYIGSIRAAFSRIESTARKYVSVMRLVLAIETSKRMSVRNGSVVFVAGLAAGIAITFASRPVSILIVLIVGGAIGYAIRSYVSYRRRTKFWEQRVL